MNINFSIFLFTLFLTPILLLLLIFIPIIGLLADIGFVASATYFFYSRKKLKDLIPILVGIFCAVLVIINVGQINQDTRDVSISFLLALGLPLILALSFWIAYLGWKNNLK